MNLLEKFFARLKENPWAARRDLTLELTEIKKIADKLVSRIDIKIKELKTVEAQVDQKMAILDGLITKLKNMPLPEGAAESFEKRGHAEFRSLAQAEKGSHAEIRSLAEKGFNSEQIARILDLPSGEVELILNLVQ
jgi:SOS response regulatory protein OraA/RecX